MNPYAKYPSIRVQGQREAESEIAVMDSGLGEEWPSPFSIGMDTNEKRGKQLLKRGAGFDSISWS